ncbi:MAG: hypothetical protein IT386_13600 [Deltaproteobacteria bacterium]|nr:hypothetical protein [Deltaproteobacteria bacterium]
MAELQVLLAREPGALAAHAALLRVLLGASREAEALAALPALLGCIEREETGLRESSA